jgi:CDP-diacylglycerol--glycerol-3-phosphate 3-phosphatidyltransferase
MPWNIPILLTWLRILMIPVFTALFYLPANWITNNSIINWCAAGIFAAAAITDWFDGYLARRWKQTSDFGAFLDPVAENAGIAQLVERNLAKVEVASSRLVSRSKDLSSGRFEMRE